jgi:hypothetical protein
MALERNTNQPIAGLASVFKDLKKATERIKMRFKTGEPEIDSLEKRLSRNDREMKRTGNQGVACMR